MFLLLSFIAMVCAVTTHPHPATTTAGITSPNHNNTTTHPTTPTTAYRRPTHCPTKQSLIAEFIRKSEYHFRAIQIDQQGFSKVLQWSLDNAFTALEHQLGKSIIEVQEDMKTLNAALDSKVGREMTAMKAQLADVQKQNQDNMTTVKSQLSDIQKQNQDLKAKNTALETKMNTKFTALETQMKTKFTTLETQMNTKFTTLETKITDGFTGMETRAMMSKHMAGCRQINNACYKVIRCDRSNTATLRSVCSKIGANVAPIRTGEIYNAVLAYQKEVGVVQLLIGGSDDVTEGTWLYYDGTAMSYSKWHPKMLSEGTKILKGEYTVRAIMKHNMVRGLEGEMLSEGTKILKGEYAVRAIMKHNMDRALIFCRTKLDCDNLERYLNEKLRGQYTALCLHSDIKPPQRKDNLERFKNAKVNFLICTDVAARGIDIKGLPYVINVTLPDDKLNYIHRIGRVGRAESMGLAISLVSNTKEKVWYHSNCNTRGKGCYNTNLTDQGGCCIWYNEPQLLGDIEEEMGVTIDQIESTMEVPVQEFEGRVTYGKKRKATGSGFKGHVAQLAPTVQELARLECRVQTSFLELKYGKRFSS